MSRSIPGTTINSYTDTGTGLVLSGTIDSGAIPTTASLFAPGCEILDLSTAIMYVNYGTTAVPIWSPRTSVKTLSLAAADLIAMYATPVKVVDAIPGRAIIVDSVEFVITRTATAFTGGGVVDVQYAATANGAGTIAHADIAATVVTGAAGTSYTFRVPTVLSDVALASIAGIGLYLSNKSAAFATGTGTAVLTVRYHIV